MNFTRMHNDYLDPDKHINGWSEDYDEGYDEEAYATHLLATMQEKEKPAFSWDDDPDYPTCAMDWADNLDADDIPIIYW